jgi:hypothetical protein
MSSYRESCCIDKHCYPNKHQAKIGMKNLARSIGVPSRKFNVYQCAYCKWFHFGNARPDIDGNAARETARYQNAILEATA